MTYHITLTDAERSAVLDVLRDCAPLRDKEGALTIHGLDLDAAHRKLESARPVRSAA